MAGPTDFDAILGRIDQGLGQDPDLDALRAVRDMLDDVAFIPGLKAYIGRNHNSLGMTEIPNRLKGLMRRAEERRDDKETTKLLIMTMAAGGGVALVVGSIVAAFALAVPAVARIPAFGGVWVGGLGYTAARRTDQERALYQQIADQLDNVVKTLESKP